MDDLLQGNTILLPFTLDPFGLLGPIAQRFLSKATTTIDPITFPRSRPNARIMHHRATTHPSPSSILQSADAAWKLNPTRRFFGYSYTAPTPQIHTLQQLGLGITKAFTLHLRNATRRDMLKHHNQPTRTLHTQTPHDLPTQPTHTIHTPTPTPQPVHPHRDNHGAHNTVVQNPLIK